MNINIGFWVPVKHVDAYFHLGGPVAIIVPGYLQNGKEGVVLQNDKVPFFWKALKILSYATLIAPLILLSIKIIYRKKHSFYVCKRVLPNGFQEIGTFIDEKLDKGIRIEGEKTVFVRPTLLLKERYLIKDGAELNFTEIVLNGKNTLVPTQKEKGANKYTLLLTSPYETLWNILQLGVKRGQETSIKEILLHANNHTMTVEGFFDYLLKPNAQGSPPIDIIQEKPFAEILDLVKKSNVAISSEVNEKLFGRWVGLGNISLVQTLLAIDPSVVKRADFIKAVLGGHEAEGKLLLQALKGQNVKESLTDKWIRRAFLNKSDFNNVEFLKLPPELQQKVYQIANIYIHKPLLQKLRSLGSYEKPVEPQWVNPIGPDMDAIDIEESLDKFLKNLRRKGCLLTEEEFPQNHKATYYHKKDSLGRILGRDFIERVAKQLNLDFVKVPKKVAVITPKTVKELAFKIAIARNDTINITCPSLQVYCEPILKIDETFSRKQLEKLLELVEITGVSDLCCNNFFMGKNSAGEKGVYFIDTEYKTFAFNVGRRSVDYLKVLAAPEDQAWFKKELDRRFSPIERGARKELPQKEKELQKERLLRYGFTNRQKPFTFPLDPILNSYPINN